MRAFSILVLVAALGAFVPARASGCEAAPGSGWRLDHFVYDASLGRDWKVLVNCDHPEMPPRIVLGPKSDRSAETREAGSKHAEAGADRDQDRQKSPGVQPPKLVRITAGAKVQVESAPSAVARILLAGTAMQTAFAGQRIRVRLDLGGRFVNGIVRGPHRVELVAANSDWGKP